MNNIDKYKIATMSLFYSLFLFVVLLMVAMPILKNAELGQFRLLSNVIKEQKRTVYLLGLLTESSLHSDVIPDDMVSEFMGSKSGIYKLNESDLITKHELKVMSVAHHLMNDMPELTSDLNSLLYYRSYDGKKMFSARRLNGFTLKDTFFSTRCEVHLTCSPNATNYSLSDRVIISPIYIDEFTGRKVITVATPAYEKGRIVGDIAMDIYLDKYSFLKNKLVKRVDNGITVTSIIEEERLSFFSDFAYFEEYVMDNRNILIYKISPIQFALSYFWIFIINYVFFYFILWRLAELKVKKDHLKSAEIKAVRDELTGLYNRSIFKQDNFITAVKKHGTAIIAIDGNKIKSINDEYGHHIGDVAIKHIADGMNITFRDSDFLVRTGGDEFLAFLIGCPQETAEKLVNELTTNIESTSFSNYALTVSVSFGITVVNNNEPLDNAIKRADYLLYANKQMERTASK